MDLILKNTLSDYHKEWQIIKQKKFTELSNKGTKPEITIHANTQTSQKIKPPTIITNSKNYMFRLQPLE